MRITGKVGASLTVDMSAYSGQDILVLAIQGMFVNTC